MARGVRVAYRGIRVLPRVHRRVHQRGYAVRASGGPAPALSAQPLLWALLGTLGTHRAGIQRACAAMRWRAAGQVLAKSSVLPPPRRGPAPRPISACARHHSHTHARTSNRRMHACARTHEKHPKTHKHTHSAAAFLRSASLHTRPQPLHSGDRPSVHAVGTDLSGKEFIGERRKWDRVRGTAADAH